MKRAVVTILFAIIVSVVAGAQGTKELDSFVSKAVAAAEKGDFSNALKHYDKAIAIVAAEPESDLDLKIDDDITDYIITNLATKDVQKAKDYALKAVELRMSCLSYLAQQGAFSSKEEYIDNLASVYTEMGITLIDVSMLEDARQCLAVAVSLYQQADVHSLGYADVLRINSIFQFDHLGDLKEGLGYDYLSFNETATLMGTNHEKSLESFNVLLRDYVRCISYLSLAGENGLLAQYREKGLLEPDYQQTKDIISLWNTIRGEIISSYGEDVYNKLVQAAAFCINGTPDILMGTYETDCLYLALLNIVYGKMSEFEKAYKVMLTMIKDPDLQMTYSDDIVTMLRNLNYPNNAIAYLYKLRDYQGEAQRNDNVEAIDVMCSLIAYNYGNYDLAWMSLSDAVYYTENDKEPVFLQEDNYASKLILAGIMATEYKNDDELALKLYQRAGKYVKGNPELEAALHNNLSTLYTKIGDYASAENEQLAAISINRQRAIEAGEDPDNEKSLMWPALNYGNLADILIDKGDIREAESLFKRCLTFYHNNYPDSRKLIHDYASLMAIADKKGDKVSMKDYCLEMYDQAFRIYLGNSLGMGKVQRADYWRHVGLDDMQQIVAQTALNLGNMNSECYDMLLRQKGFLLAQQRMITDNVGKSDDERLKEAFLLFKEGERKGDENTRRLENKFMYQYSTHREFLEPHRFPTWSDVRASLGKDDAAVEFTTCCSDGNTVKYAAMIIKNDWKEPKMVSTCSSDDLTIQFRRKFRAYRGSNVIYDLVWKEIEPFLETGGKVYFSPDGLLDQMNIEIAADASGISMGDKYEMIRVSSTSNLCDSFKPTGNRDAALYGGFRFDADTTSMVRESRKYISSVTSSEIELDTLTRGGWAYLPATKTEIEKIDAILSKKSINVASFSGENGTEESFKALTGAGTGIIHVATHGFYLNRNQSADYGQVLIQNEKNDTHDYPLRRCGLIFSGGEHAWKGETLPDGIEDGILTGEEIAGMDLSGNDILVLSACQTGLGEITGDGVYGLRRAFKIAGAGTIVMSLWDVNDKATEMMMTNMYKGLADGLDKRSAFNKAVASVKESFSSPEYWAAFIMLD